MLNAILAFSSLPDELDRFCRSTGTNWARVFWKVRLPAAMPQCFVGFKYAALNATVGANHRRIHRLRPGFGLLYPDFDRQYAPRPRLRRHLPADLLGLLMFGLAAVALRRSHHIGCLAAFLEEPARMGHLVLVLSSDPAESRVAPFGGVTPVLMPDPIAAGIPRRPDPILIDVSTSITTMGMVGRSRSEGRKLGGLWLQDAQGKATDDPNVVGNGGALLPVGGQDHGHKGFGFGLLVEALTQGLGGYGRADKPTDWGAAVTVLAIAPSRFAGEDAFLRQMDFTAELCLAAKPRDPQSPVRLPGQLAAAKKRQAEREGVALHPGIAEKLAALGEKFGIAPSAT